MSDLSGHNWNTSVHAEREALRTSLSDAQASLDLTFGDHRRRNADLTRTRWQDSAAAPYDRALAAREALRAAHARRARILDELAECDYELFDDGDDGDDDGSAYDDMAA
jgi:hypothetical protein